MNILLSSLKELFKVVSTNRCSLCGEVVEIDAKLCDECAANDKIKLPRCGECGCFKDDCVCCGKKSEYNAVTAPYYYIGSTIRGVHNFKNNDMPFLAASFAKEMYGEIKREYKGVDFDYIAYVPLTEKRWLKRGFNQSQLLAQELEKLMNIKAEPLLIKIRDTGVQHLKTARQRAADAYGSYDVAGKYKYLLSGKTILLTDDVKTTGATLNECAKMLKIYGAKAVYCAAFAITKKKKENCNN